MCPCVFQNDHQESNKNEKKTRHRSRAQTMAGIDSSYERRRMRYSVLLLLLLQLHVDTISAKQTKDNNHVNSDVHTQQQHSTSTLLPQTHCHAWAGATCEWEPNLHPMTVRYENGYNETFYAYVTPHVGTFYNETSSTTTATQRRSVQEPKFQGFFAKFTNLSPKPIQVHWRSPSAGHALTYITDIEPFGSAGTATYPHHVFVATPPPPASPDTKSKSKSPKVLATWVMTKETSLYYYDPFRGQTSRAQKALTIEQYHLYHIQYQNQAFAGQYKAYTGDRDWLGLYQHRLPPRFHMWRADALGQTHVVTTDEIHFVERPPAGELRPHPLEGGVSIYGPRPDEVQRMRPYRATLPTLTLELKVLSCAPRVLEIRNFLSSVEVDHILQLAAALELRDSTTRAGESAAAVTNESTRTSRNSWIGRNTDMIIDAIHKRAADVLQLPEALLRYRRSTEIPELNAESMISVAERLQLVHYSVGQQYTPHHDFSMPALIKDQPSRFATILFYLNDDMVGGETAFPRWINAETSEALLVKPERGKAILFYNMLPDGNYDERSQHAALPVLSGEKFLINLWVWDPVLDHTATEML